MVKVEATNTEPIIAIYPIDDQGIERKWRYAFQSITEIYDYLIIEKTRLGNFQIKMPKYSDQFKTMWYLSKYNAGDNGTKVISDMGFSKNDFEFPKSIYTVNDCIYAVSDKNDVILDYFAGSGTTGQVVLSMNRRDGGNRKYILVEMGEYFTTTTKPRIMKSIYSMPMDDSAGWKDGKPVSRNGSSHAFKYISLESYEDSLNNIEFTGESPKLTDQAKEEYVLSYMLKMQSEQSACLLNIDKLKNPFAYEMKITKNLETKTQAVDLVETFSYLIGLQIEHSYAKVSFDAAYTKGEKGVLVAKLVNGSTYTFKMIEGKQLSGDKVLVIWRTLTGDAEKDNAALDAFFAKKHLNPADFEFNKIYVNGDNNLENIRTDEEHWKVMLIEEEMKKLMFEQE